VHLFFTSRAAGSKIAGSKIALHFLRLFVCWLVYMSTLSTCTIITSRTLLPCNFTLVDLMAAMNTGVATTRVTGSSFNTVFKLGCSQRGPHWKNDVTIFDSVSVTFINDPAYMPLQGCRKVPRSGAAIYRPHAAAENFFFRV